MLRVGGEPRVRAEGRLQLPGPADPVGQVLQLPRARRPQPQGRAAVRHQGRRLRPRPNRAPAPSCRAISTRASSDRRITAADEAERMPPKSLGRTLSPQEIDVLKRWIEQGGEWQVALVVPAAGRGAGARGQARRVAPQPDRPLRPGPHRGRGPHAGRRGEQGAADPPRHLRPHRAAPDPRRDRRLPGRSATRRPTSGWSIACWPRRGSASAWPSTGSTWPATPTPTATRPTAIAPPGPGATGSSARSTPTSPTTGSSPGNWPATCCRTPPATRSWPRPSTGTIARPTRAAASRRSSASSTSPTGPTPSRRRSWA